MKLRLLSLAVAAAFALPAHAATPLAQLRYTPDITVSLAGVTVGPADVAADTLSGIPTLALTGLPANVAAYHYAGGGVHWLVFATTVLLPGGITATPRDIVSWNGAAYTLILNGATAGIPNGVAIDALASTDGTDYLLSFDTTATVGAVTAAPQDVVRYAGGAWAGYFAGSTSGAPAGANLDALHTLSNGHLLVSFDIAGTAGGVAFSSGDVLEFTPSGSVWEMAFSPASLYAGWGAANLRGLWAAEAPPGAPGTLQFSAPTYSVNESGVTATITVTRTGGNTGPVTVHYATADGTANAPADYAATTGTLSWANGASAAQTFAIPIVNDLLVEGNETVHLALSAPTGGATLGTAAALLTIIDDDLPVNTPMAGVSTANLNFGNQALATASGSQTVTVTNNGNAALNIASVTPGGANAADFGIVSDTCSGAGIAPTASCTIGLRFTPGALGARSASLAIASNAVAASASLSGIGIAAAAPGAGGVAGIPTLSEWGLALLSLLLAGLGMFKSPLSVNMKRRDVGAGLPAKNRG